MRDFRESETHGIKHETGKRSARSRTTFISGATNGIGQFNKRRTRTLAQSFGFGRAEQRVQRRTRASTNVNHALSPLVPMTGTPGNINIDTVSVAQPRPMHINDFDVVADKCRRWFIPGVVVGVEWFGTGMTYHPIPGLLRNRCVLEDEHRIRAHDVALKNTRTCKGRLIEIVHVVGDEHFVEMSIGVRQQNWRAAHTQSFGTAAYPVRGIAGRQQEFC